MNGGAEAAVRLTLPLVGRVPGVAHDDRRNAHHWPCFSCVAGLATGGVPHPRAQSPSVVDVGIPERLRSFSDGRLEGKAMTRPRTPRPSVVVRPSFVSQETAFTVLGLTPRKFLDVLVPRCRADVVRVGRTVLLPTEVAEVALRSLTGGRATTVPEREGDDDEQPATVDAILASVGMHRRTGR